MLVKEISNFGSIKSIIFILLICSLNRPREVLIFSGIC